MTDRMSEDGFFSRREFLKDAALTIATAYFWPAKPARASTFSQFSWEPPRAIQLLMDVRTEEDARYLAYSHRDLLDGDIFKYYYDSNLNDRPHQIIIPRNGNEPLFKRIVLSYYLPKPQIDYFTSLYGRPETVTGPSYYGISDLATHNNPPDAPGLSYEDVEDLSTICQTLVYPNLGRAVVINRYIQQVLELHQFGPTSTAEYVRKFGQGDYNPAASPVSRMRPPLITIDGLNSHLENQLDRNDRTFRAYNEALSEHFDILPFSYNGGNFSRVPGSDKPVWLPLPYDEEATRKSPLKVGPLIKTTIDQIWDVYEQPVSGLVYSNGGADFWWGYLLPNVLAQNGSHRGKVGKVVYLDPALNGIPEPILTAFLQLDKIDSPVGNEATQFLAGLARDEKTWQNTIDNNTSSADFLANYLNIDPFIVTNEDDCFVQPRSAAIRGHTRLLKLGRGRFGIPSCDVTDIALLLPGAVTNIGHDQILTAQEAVDLVTAHFLGTS